MAANSISEALINYLRTQSDLTDIVNQRIYFITPPSRPERPYLLVRQMRSSDRPRSFEIQQSGIPTYELLIVGKETQKSSLRTLATNLVDMLNLMKRTTMDGLYVEQVICDGPIEDRDTVADDGIEMRVEAEIDYYK